MAQQQCTGNDDDPVELLKVPLNTLLCGGVQTKTVSGKPTNDFLKLGNSFPSVTVVAYHFPRISSGGGFWILSDRCREERIPSCPT